VNLPSGVRLENAPDGKTLSNLLACGELDAVIGPRAPSCYQRGASNVGYLFPNPQAAATEWFNRTRIFPIMHLVGVRRTLVEQHPWLPAAVLKACVGRDGGLSTDKFLTAPEECHFQPKDIQCTVSDQPECLTGEQVGAFEAMYRGARDPRSGEVIYYSWPKGSENSGRVVKSLPCWSLYWADPAHPDLPARSNFWKLWAFDNPNGNWTMFDFGADMKAVDDRLAANINAMNSDLTAFRAADGKMIHYHGLSDPVVPPRDSIDYFEDVQRNLVKSSAAPADASANFYRLFLAPGMEHCRGGDGPNVLDAQRALEEWVEQVKSPDTIAATKFVNDKPADGIALSRPLCPYPQEARYTGRGDPNFPENFACQPGHRYPEPLTGKLYRR
jgi:feruloyl esterase